MIIENPKLNALQIYIYQRPTIKIWSMFYAYKVLVFFNKYSSVKRWDFSEHVHFQINIIIQFSLLFAINIKHYNNIQVNNHDKHNQNYCKLENQYAWMTQTLIYYAISD